jgi:hypothetical protein
MKLRIAKAPAREMLDRFREAPFSKDAQRDFILSMHGQGIAEEAHRWFCKRGRGMMVGPIKHGSGFVAFQYAVRAEIERQAPDPEVRGKVLEFVDKYDPATQWVIMLMDTNGVFVALRRCARHRPTPKGE